MKLNMRYVLITVLMAIVILCPAAFGSEATDYTYTVSNGAVTITKYTGSETEIVIPSVIEDTPVTGIGADAFEYNNTVKSIVVPEGVTFIGLDAFAGCPALETVVLPDSVETLWSYAFRDCTALTSVNYPKNWNSTGNSGSYRYETPFKNCPNLKSITVPEGVTVIPYYAFSAFAGLEEITLPSTLETISTEAFMNCTSLKAVEIPATVTGIGTNAFRNCVSLTKLTVPGGVATISDSAFDSCTSLEKLTVNAGVTSINYRAFFNCTALKDVTLPEGLVVIGLDAFNTCTALESIVIPDSVEILWSYSFSNCTALTSVNYPKSWNSTGNSGSYRYETPFKNCPNLKNIAVPEGVTVIPYYAFSAFAGLEEITLPSTLETISPEAFMNCVSLKAVEIPENVTGIGTNAFRNCVSLTELTVPGSVAAISDSAFDSCTSLEELTVNAGVTSINYRAFFNCTSLKDVTLPEGLITIGLDAFNTCTALENIVIPDSVETLWSYSFNNCTALTGVNYPKNWKNTGTSGSYRYETPFGNCPNLKSIAVPEGATAIPVYAFANCTSLEEITLPSTLETIGAEAFQGATALKAVLIPESVTGIGAHAFNGCTGLTELTVPGGVATIGQSAFAGCTSLEKLTLEEGVTTLNYQAFNGCSALKDVSLPEGLLVIGRDAFRYCTALESIVIPDSVETLWSYSFENCTSLSSVNYPVNWKNTGTSGSYRYETPFKNCPNLKSIAVPDGATAIPTYAFENCTSLEEITLPNTLETIGSVTFRGATALKTIVIPESVTAIGSSAFNGCKSLTEITIPGSVATVSDYAFQNCTGLVKLVVEAGVTRIGEWAFNACTSLVDVTLPEGLLVIGRNAFSSCTALESIDLPDSIETLWSYSFASCTNLSSVNYPLNWKNTGTSGTYRYETPFNGCPNLKSIAVPDGATAIPTYAFENCTGLEEITLPSTLETIGSDAFHGATALKTIVIPESVTAIGSNAFNGCKSLAEITIPGSVATVSDSAFQNCTGLAKLVVEEGVTRIGEWAFSTCTSLTDVTLPEGLLVIGRNAFSSCTALESIDLPDSIETLWSYSFASCTNLSSVNYPLNWKNTGTSGTYRYETPFNGCTNLKSIAVPEGATAIPVYAFDTCTSLEEITLPSTLETIGSEAFHGATALKTIAIPESVTAIGTSAFYGCKSLTEITIPGSVVTVSDSAFQNCTGLTILVVEAGVTRIGEWAFNTCTSLTDVTLPEGLLVIGRNAFSSCTALHSIDLPDSLETIWSYSFASCTNLSSVNYPVNWKNTGTSGTYRYTSPFTDTAVTAVDIPEGATAVPNYAFKDSGIQQVWMPRSLESFGSESFANCSGMTAYCWSGSPIHYVMESMNDFLFELRDPHVHDFEFFGEATATCTENGVQNYRCSQCPYMKSESVEAYGHAFGVWVTEIPATFIQEGLKARKCARCDLREEEVIPKLIPGEDDEFGHATFRVVDAETKEPISGANICVYCYEEGEVTITTDEDGYASETLPVGQWMVSAYASGKKIRNLGIAVERGECTYPDIGLSSRDLVSAKMTSREMTLEEMIEAGIDITDASNQHRYEYKVKLEFSAGIDALEISMFGGIGIGWGDLPGSGGAFPPSNGSGDDDDDDDGEGGVGEYDPDSIPNPFWDWECEIEGNQPVFKCGEGEKSITVYPVNERFFLIIYGEVNWLKEMFDVEMIVFNHSMTDTFEDGMATLNLPDGLSLAKMRDDLGQQSLFYEISTLEGGESQSVHWYVRGDKPGNYNITALLEGVMQPFGETVYQEFECENAINVLAGNAMRLTYYVPNMAYYGEPYHIKAVLRNVSDKILYNVHHKITKIQQQRVTVYSDDTEKVTGIFDTIYDWKDARDGEFHPGERIEIEGDIIIKFESELAAQQLDKVRRYAQGIDNLMEGIDTLSAGLEAASTAKDLIENLNTIISDNKMTEEKLEAILELQSEKGMAIFDELAGEYDGDISISELTDAVCDFLESIPLQFQLIGHTVECVSGQSSSIPTNIVTEPAVRKSHVASADGMATEVINAFREEAHIAAHSGSSSHFGGTYEGVIDALSMNKESAKLIATGGVMEDITVIPAVSDTLCKAWSGSNSFTLSVMGNDTKTNQTLGFVGGAVLEVVPAEMDMVYTDTLYIDNGDDTIYTYEITVYPSHECGYAEQTILLNPQEERPGIAVGFCDVCGEVLDIEKLESCGNHVFPGYTLAIPPEDGDYGIKTRVCEVCHLFEYIIVDEHDVQQTIVGFDANGGEGAMAGLGVPYGSACVIPENAFTFEDMNFICWNTAADGTGDTYLPGAEVVFEEGVILYAQWSRTERMDFNMSKAAWTANELVYDETEKTVWITGLPASLEAVYTGNTATDTGEYTASVTFVYDDTIYNEPVMPDHTWRIVPAIRMAENVDKVYDGLCYLNEAYTLAVQGVVAESFYEKTVTGEGDSAVTEWVSLDGAPSDAGDYRLDVQITFGENEYTAYDSIEYTISRRPVTLTADNVLTVYSGKPQGGANSSGDLPEGHWVSGTVISGEATEAGTYPGLLMPERAVIRDGYGAITTNNYDIEFRPGDLDIEKCPITVIANDVWYYYDGEPHGGDSVTLVDAAEGHSVSEMTINGEETEIGVYEGRLEPVAVTIIDETGADVTHNYLIAWQAGTLEIRQVFAEQILLSVSALYAEPGDRVVPAAQVLPENTTDKGIVWTSDAPEVAEVDESGRLTVLAEGTAKITASAADGSGTIAEFTVEAADMNNLVLPEALKTVRAEAFIGNTALEAVDLSANVGATIEDSAFADCTALVKMVLPEGASFGMNVFEGTDRVVLYCADEAGMAYAGSAGLQYVQTVE